jgi:tetratricopeptide (TPR) repeat protein
VAAPAHPEVRLWQGVMALEAGDGPAAAAHLAEVVRQRPDDGRIWRLLGQAQDLAGEGAHARDSLARAAALARSASDWLALSQECDRQGLYEQALAAAQALLRLQPDSAVARLQRARCSMALGDAATAAADCRALIAEGREPARAWFMLLDLKVERLSADELQRLEQEDARPGRGAQEQLLTAFALGQALEAAGEPARALAAFERANAAVRSTLRWDADALERRVSAAAAAFAASGTPETTPGAAARAGGHAEPLGDELIFLVGLPRSGSTLVEQVLAAHPQVEGASELPHLPQLIEAESRRRGRPYPQWVAQAGPDDWARLGREYLRLTARWRQHRPVSTDKLPDNWQHAAAIRAMLPGAHIIDCRRDAVQTCWSCFKQLFGPGLAAYSYDFESLARYAVACEREGDRLAALHPAHVRVQQYESLVADAAGQVRELLAFCGLPFDAACLDFQQAQRAIRTPSALQVRQPMTKVSAPADRYGELLAPLREALARARSA